MRFKYGWVITVAAVVCMLWATYAFTQTLPKLIAPASRELASQAVPKLEQTIQKSLDTQVATWMNGPLTESIVISLQTVVDKRIEELKKEIQKEINARLDTLQVDIDTRIGDIAPDSEAMADLIGAAVDRGIESKLAGFTLSPEDIWAVLSYAATNNAAAAAQP